MRAQIAIFATGRVYRDSAVSDAKVAKIATGEPIVRHVASPRQWLQDPAYFSTGSQLWRTPANDMERAELRAAKWQQIFVEHVRDAARHTHLTHAQLAEKAGMSKYAISRIINGDTWLDLKQVAQIEDVFRLDLLSRSRPDLG